MVLDIDFEDPSRSLVGMPQNGANSLFLPYGKKSLLGIPNGEVE